MRIADFQFKGELPALSPRKLPEGYAQTADNCDFRDGGLRAIKGLEAKADLDGVRKSIYKIGDTWLDFSGDVSFARASVFDDSSRLYYMGDSYPRQRKANGDILRLGVPAPPEALNIQIEGTAEEGARVLTTTVYVYTYVNALGEEGAFSPPSAPFPIKEGEYAQLSNFLAPEPAVAGFTGDKIRIYRSSTGGTSGVVPFMLVDEIDYPGDFGGFTHDDQKDASELTYTAESEFYDIPHASLEGLVSTQNGLMFAFKDNEVHICEPFLMYAYPQENMKTTESDVMGIGFYEGAVVVTTKTRPYILTGYQPVSMDFRPLPYLQACESKKSVVNIPGGVIYATPSGLFLLSGSGGSLITEDIISPEQWKAAGPEDIMAVNWRGKYLAFYEGTDKGFLLDPKDPFVSPIDLDGVDVNGIHYSAEDDAVYLSCTDGAANKIMKWDAEGYLDYAYKSRKVFSQRAVSFAAARITGNFSGARDVKFTLIGDGADVTEHTCTGEGWFRLDSGRKYNDIEYLLEGDADIDAVYLGMSIGDVRG